MSVEHISPLQKRNSGESGNMYFSPDEAKRELLARKKDPSLLKAVMDVIGELPHGLSRDEPFAVLSRHVATARMEDIEFMEEMNRIGIPPTWIEYTHDLFTSANPDKNALWKLFVFKGKSKGGTDRTKRFRIVNDPCCWERKRICDLATPWGESLIDFHHRLRLEVFSPEVAGRIVDASQWLERHGGKAKLYYRAYLSLFMVHGVLCEDFEEFPDQPSNYPEFRENVFLPSWRWAVKHFGIEPIIIRLPWRRHLDWYHPNIEHVLEKNGAP